MRGIESQHALHEGFAATDALALNALLLAEHYGLRGSTERDAFDAFLRRLHSYDWPLDCQANEQFCRASGFSRDELREMAQVTHNVPESGWSVEVLTDPLEILNLGNAFDSCLRFGGKKMGILGCATNANIIVLAVRDHDGRILGRRTLGLLSAPERTYVLAPSYPMDSSAIEDATAIWLQALECTFDLGRSSAPKQVPCATYARSYTDGFV